MNIYLIYLTDERCFVARAFSSCAACDNVTEKFGGRVSSIFMHHEFNIQQWMLELIDKNGAAFIDPMQVMWAKKAHYPEPSTV